MPELILTCEHAGNEVPENYRHLFEKEPEVLFTHRGVDIGALELAKELEKELKAPLFYNTVTRLLIEANRSEGLTGHYSEFSEVLPERDKKWLLQQVYLPYRNQVIEKITELINSGKQVIHFSVHSFTPELNGEKRDADIGLLFDPERKFEAIFCSVLTEELQQLDDSLLIKDNYPYLGTADGFTTHLRTLFPDENYAGIELEVNQKFPETKENWQHVQSVIACALKVTMHRLGETKS